MPIHDKYTAGINKLRLWASLVNPYCAKHDLPSPTDSQLPVHNFQHTVSDGFPVSGFGIIPKMLHTWKHITTFTKNQQWVRFNRFIILLSVHIIVNELSMKNIAPTFFDIYGIFSKKGNVNFLESTVYQITYTYSLIYTRQLHYHHWCVNLKTLQVCG